MAPHSSTLAWKIPWMEEPSGLQPMGSLRVGHDSATSLSLFSFMHWRRKWQPTPEFLPGESQGQGSLVGCRLWGRTESDKTEATQQQQQQQQCMYEHRRTHACTYTHILKYARCQMNLDMANTILALFLFDSVYFTPTFLFLAIYYYYFYLFNIHCSFLPTELFLNGN